MNSRTFNPFKLLVDSVKYEMKTFSFKVNKKEYKFGYQLIHFTIEDDYQGILVQWNNNEKITVSGKTEDDIIEGLKSKIYMCDVLKNLNKEKEEVLENYLKKEVKK